MRRVVGLVVLGASIALSGCGSSEKSTQPKEDIPLNPPPQGAGQPNQQGNAQNKDKTKGKGSTPRPGGTGTAD